MHLPYELLSDVDLEFATLLDLSTFEWKDRKLIMRLALTFEDGRTIMVSYRVFPPRANSKEVVAWLASKS